MIPLYQSKKVSASNNELKDKLLEISGIKITSTASRVYPLGEETAHLIGYVQAISADELKAKEKEKAIALVV